jgi:glycosyltransferase involved in cell wall biosynthesis
MENSKPKLLFISQNLPKRFASSGVMRLYYFVKLLCRDFEVVVATYFMPAFDKPEDVKALEALGAQVEAVPFDYPREGSDRFSPKLPARVRSLLENGAFEIIHLERFWMHICLDGLWEDLGIPVVLDEIDVEYKREERRLSMQGADERAWNTWALEKQQELAVCQRVDHVIAVTEADRKRLLGECPDLDITVIPTGQDVSWLNDVLIEKMEPRAAGVVFCGDYRHNPNVDAALFLVHDIWPRVLEGCPKAQLTLLGANPPDEVQALAAFESVEVPGWIDDLRPYYRREKIMLAPIRFGSGIKAKVIEAGAFALPIVTTSIGAEGLNLEPGRDYFVEDDADGLAARTLQLLLDDALCRAMGVRAREKAAEYDWETLYPAYRDIYLSLVSA